MQSDMISEAGVAYYLFMRIRLFNSGWMLYQERILTMTLLRNLIDNVRINIQSDCVIIGWIPCFIFPRVYHGSNLK